MKIYLAGPMRGYFAYNHPAFDAAAARLRAEHHIVFSPAEEDRHRWPYRPWATYSGDPIKDGITNIDLRTMMKTDTGWICDHADAIALLPNWERSEGSGIEWHLARYFKLKFIYNP